MAGSLGMPPDLESEQGANELLLRIQLVGHTGMLRARVRLPHVQLLLQQAACDAVDLLVANALNLADRATLVLGVTARLDELQHERRCGWGVRRTLCDPALGCAQVASLDQAIALAARGAPPVRRLRDPCRFASPA